MVQNAGKLKLGPSTRVGVGAHSSSVRRKLPAAAIGPTVCGDDGWIPILKSSKKLIIGFCPRISPTSASYSSAWG
jgi:hypothetical protein